MDRYTTGLSPLYRDADREHAQAIGGVHVSRCCLRLRAHPGVGVSTHLGRLVAARRSWRTDGRLSHDGAFSSHCGIAAPSRVTQIEMRMTRASEPEAELDEIEEAECLEILGRHGLGRIAIVVDGQPQIFPVNYAINGRIIAVRTGAD